METRNIGTFESLVRIKNEIPAEIQIFKIKEICKKYKVYFKQHNTDYLSDESLNWHPKLGIHAANVAPEFGVAETRNLLNLMKKYKMLNLYDEFIDLCAKSNKWKKWKIDGSKLNDYQKTIICGHYLYSSEKGKAIIDETKSRLIKKNINYQNLAKKIVKKSILRYMNCFKLIGAN